MGGFCGQRAGCPNYEAKGRARKEPAERLCVKGADGVRIDHAHEQEERDRKEMAQRLAEEQGRIWARDFVRMMGQKA
jgi:hypothetical protein